MQGSKLTCGVDEAGRGPLAGPVCAAAVILPDEYNLPGLTDSKKLTAKRRDVLAADIKQCALAWSVAWASVEEIDTLNIRQANLLAMQRAVEGLSIAPAFALIDGNDPPSLACAARAIVGGDGLEPCISAASILAKTARDETMVEIDKAYPVYGFAAHKGYGVAKHMEALRNHGPCPHHRMSFRPVREALRSG